MEKSLGIRKKGSLNETQGRNESVTGPLLSPGNGKTKTGRIWTYVRDERPWGSDVPPAAYYRFSMDRKGIRPAEHLKSYSGFMHADAYAGFEELYRSGRITAVACMAHIRREFFDEAQSNGTSTAIGNHPRN